MLIFHTTFVPVKIAVTQIEENRNNKIEAFRYFSERLKDIYEEVFQKEINLTVKNTELYRQKVLYFSCLFSKDYKLFETFNNWQSWPKGPVEEDIHKYFFEI